MPAANRELDSEQQACKLNQIIFAGYTHDPAQELARLLLNLAPRGVEHVFYSDSSSASVEVALKMALGYRHHIGEQRTRIVVMQHSYQGDTFGRCQLVPAGSSTQRTPLSCSTRPQSRSLRAVMSRRRLMRLSQHVETTIPRLDRRASGIRGRRNVDVPSLEAKRDEAHLRGVGHSVHCR
ncbi:aminotransferase class III-fold pyridoxal phosphate-dependent enzyme [Bradyrhizobium sp. S3.7.6]